MELKFNTRQSEINVVEQFRNSVKISVDLHIEKLKKSYNLFESIISKFIEDLGKEKKIFSSAPFCSECCLLCYEQGEFAINSSSYHKICRLCRGFNIRESLNCHHCSSSVKLTKYPSPDCVCGIQNFHSFLSILTKTQNICRPGLKNLPKILTPAAFLFEFLLKPEEDRIPSTQDIDEPAVKRSLSRENPNLPKIQGHSRRLSVEKLNLGKNSLKSLPPKSNLSKKRLK